MNGYHYTPIIAEEMTEEFRSVRGCCCVSPHSLHSSTSQDQTRPALQGGWVCFQFSPLPCPGKHHFQNQTHKKKKGKKDFSVTGRNVCLPRFMYLTFILEAVQ